MQKTESSDLEDITPPPKESDLSRVEDAGAPTGASANSQANDLASQNLYKKVSQRKQII